MMEEITSEQVAAASDSVTGDLRLHEFHSSIFRNARMLRVWLPPRYDAPENVTRHYPVVYLNDGQNLFDRATAFAGVEWQVDDTADRLIRQEVIPPLIVVGIDNTQGDRIKEYLPYRSFHPPVLRPQ
jgi:enterochelin esterase-like enzyme